MEKIYYRVQFFHKHLIVVKQHGKLAASVILLCSEGGRQEGPLPLLPADDVPIQLSQHVVGPSKASRSVAATQPSQPANSRDHG